MARLRRDQMRENGGLSLPPPDDYGFAEPDYAEPVDPDYDYSARDYAPGEFPEAPRAPDDAWGEPPVTARRRSERDWRRASRRQPERFVRPATRRNPRRRRR